MATKKQNMGMGNSPKGKPPAKGGLYGTVSGAPSMPAKGTKPAMKPMNKPAK